MRTFNFLFNSARSTQNIEDYDSLTYVWATGVSVVRAHEHLKERGLYVPLDQLEALFTVFNIQLSMDIGARQDEAMRAKLGDESDNQHD